MWGRRKQQQEGALSLSVQPGALLEFQIWWLGCEVELLSGNLHWILRNCWRHVLHHIRRGGGREKGCFFSLLMQPQIWLSSTQKMRRLQGPFDLNPALFCETSDWGILGRAGASDIEFSFLALMDVSAFFVAWHFAAAIQQCFIVRRILSVVVVVVVITKLFFQLKLRWKETFWGDVCFCSVQNFRWGWSFHGQVPGLTLHD